MNGSYVYFASSHTLDQTPMQFISVKQPWAHLLVHGLKSVENRNKPLPKSAQAQWIGIHAIKTKDDISTHVEEACKKANIKQSLLRVKCVMKSEKGHLIGAVMFVQTKPQSVKETPFKDYPSPTRFHWYVQDYVALETPILLTGGQGWPKIRDLNTKIKILQCIAEHTQSQV